MEVVSDVQASEAAQWPSPIVEDFTAGWPVLCSESEEHDVEKWVINNKKILIRTSTWNLCAKPPPNIESLCANLLPTDRFHVYVIGTEECERSIAQSVLNPSKKTWEAYLKEALGPNYVPIRSHTLQAIHLMVFVHRKIAHMCSVVTSAAVPTGVGSTLGNKGGVGLFFKIGDTRFLIVNAHLAAHQTAEKRRNAEFNRINKMIPVLLEKKEASVGSSTPKARQAKEKSAQHVTKSNSKVGVVSISANSRSTPTASDSTAPSPTTQQATATTVPGNDSTVAVSATPTNCAPSDSTIANTTAADGTAVAANAAPAPAPIEGGGVPELHLLETVLNDAGKVMTVADRCEGTQGGENGNLPNDTEGPNSASSSVAPPSPFIMAGTGAGAGAGAGTEESEEFFDIPCGIDGIEADEHQQAELEASHQAAALLENSENAIAYPNEADDTINTILGSNYYNSSVRDLGIPADDATEQEQEGVETSADVNVVNKLDGTAILEVTEVTSKTLENTADFVVFMGDLNYRIKGNRKIVSSLVANNMHEVLLHNDQLAWNMARGLVLQNFTEAPLNFKPTYKYDVGTDVYDTSSKGRIPSWTDRILYVPRPGVQCLAYNADESVKTSDHRPVYASFSVDIELPAAVVATYATDAPTVQSGAGASAGTANATSANGGSADGNVVQVQNISNMTTAEHKKLPEFTSESQVCTIM